MDDEYVLGRNRNPLPQASPPSAFDRRSAWDLSGLSGFEGLHLAIRTDLDQRDRPPQRLSAWIGFHLVRK